jgi:hypothetical protein
MKKYVYSIVALLFISNYGIAQNNTTADLRNDLLFGLIIGTNYSNVYDSKNKDFKADSKFGFVAGVTVAIPIGTYLGFHPEILFSQKGFQGSGSILGSSYSFTRTTNYIDIPLLIAFKPLSKLTIVAGPQYSYLLKQKDVFTNTLYSSIQEDEFDNDNIRKNTLCFLGGVEVNINHIVIGARVGWDVMTNNGDGSSDTPQYKNMWYQFAAGLRF